MSSDPLNNAIQFPLSIMISHSLPYKSADPRYGPVHAAIVNGEILVSPELWHQIKSTADVLVEH